MREIYIIIKVNLMACVPPEFVRAYWNRSRAEADSSLLNKYCGEGFDFRVILLEIVEE